MADESWDRILNPDVSYNKTYSTDVVPKGWRDPSGNNAFANYAAETAVVSNPQFAWPKPTYTDISGNTQVMRRGFIRSILLDPAVFDPLQRGATTTARYTGTSDRTGIGLNKDFRRGHRRLNFQFNPDYLERSVTQSPGAMNPLLQNPAMLTQSVPGTAVFGFSMQFNREMEVAKGAAKGVNLKSKYADFYGDGFGAAFEDLSANPDPELIGVLADLMVFDSIIGQGISPDLVSAVTAFTERTVRATTEEVETEELDEEGNKITETVNKEFKEEDVTNLLSNINFGNSAFLTPLPVRIVFSDYFMVEGIVTASNVGFQKFSKDLIPTVCQINVSVQALYIGFAQRDAYLTKQLTDSSLESEKNAIEGAAEIEKLSKELTKNWSSMFIRANDHALSPYLQDDSDGVKIPDNTNGLGYKLWEQSWDDNEYPGRVAKSVGFPMWYNGYHSNAIGPNEKPVGWVKNPVKAMPFRISFSGDYRFQRKENSGDLKFKIINPTTVVDYQFTTVFGTESYTLTTNIDIREDLQSLAKYGGGGGGNYGGSFNLYVPELNEKLPLKQIVQTYGQGGQAKELSSITIKFDAVVYYETTISATGETVEIESKPFPVSMRLKWGTVLFDDTEINNYSFSQLLNTPEGNKK
jgi:hypothetical protein